MVLDNLGIKRNYFNYEDQVNNFASMLEVRGTDDKSIW
jgi:hypothetical protein